MFDLQGKVALITGSSRGIGRNIAEAYAQAGAKVVLASRKQQDLDAVAAEIQAQGAEALAVAVNTSNAEEIENLAQKVLDHYGRIDIIVNNGATNPHFGPILTAKDSHWDKILDVNVKGYFHVIRVFAETMKQQKSGKIINIASIAGLNPMHNIGAYSVSKAAVIMLTKVLAHELAEYNIQVNSISPGLIKTKFSQALWEDPEMYESMTKLIPQKRIATPEEITGIALYLASSASSFTTGSNFVVDGGQTLGPTV